MSAKIWYHDQIAWPTLQPAMPTAMSNRHRRWVPVCRRAVHQHATAAATPAASWALSSTTMAASFDSSGVLSSAMTTATKPTNQPSADPSGLVVIGPPRRRRHGEVLSPTASAPQRSASDTTARPVLST